MIHEKATDCPLCDEPASASFVWNEPDETVGYHGGANLHAFWCEGGHTEDDLSGPQLRELEERALEWVQEDMEVRYDEEMERRMDERRLGLG